MDSKTIRHSSKDFVTLPDNKRATGNNKNVYQVPCSHTAKEIKKIEDKLNQYLYDFSCVVKNSSNLMMFDGNPKSTGYSFKKK